MTDPTLIQSAPQHGHGDTAQHTNGDAPREHWTIMVYMSADAILANFAIESLKQIRSTAGRGVLVAAQLDTDGITSVRTIPRYLFTNATNNALGRIATDVTIPKGKTAAEILADFISSVLNAPEYPEYKDGRHALILWGHGPQLLFQPPANTDQNGCGKTQRLYLTPIELRKALEAAGFSSNRKLDIIGFDACSLSLIEVAYEIKELADFMIASQDEVPDLSFPYNAFLHSFRKANGNIAELCAASLEDYVLAYQDYICTPNTNAKKASLSCIRLDKVGGRVPIGNDAGEGEFQPKDSVAYGLNKLTKALLDARGEKNLPRILIDARAESPGFSGGLFVDLFTFCEKLSNSVSGEEKLSNENSQHIESACTIIKKALATPDTNSLIVANRSPQNPQYHGLSIYFPYLGQNDIPEMKQPLVKGTGDTLGGKSVANVLNQAAINARFDVREQLIDDTEDYYPELKLSLETNWYRFITHQWSRILAERVPNELDLRYSAQQCAINLLLRIKDLEIAASGSDAQIKSMKTEIANLNRYIKENCSAVPKPAGTK